MTLPFSSLIKRLFLSLRVSCVQFSFSLLNRTDIFNDKSFLQMKQNFREHITYFQFRYIIYPSFIVVITLNHRKHRLIYLLPFSTQKVSRTNCIRNCQIFVVRTISLVIFISLFLFPLSQTPMTNYHYIVAYLKILVQV